MNSLYNQPVIRGVDLHSAFTGDTLPAGLIVCHGSWRTPLNPCSSHEVLYLCVNGSGPLPAFHTVSWTSKWPCPYSQSAFSFMDMFSFIPLHVKKLKKGDTPFIRIPEFMYCNSKIKGSQNKLSGQKEVAKGDSPLFSPCCFHGVALIGISINCMWFRNGLLDL